MEETNGWHSKYDLGIYITSPVIDNTDYINYTKECMDYLKWKIEIIEGDISLLENLIEGNWNERDFLVCPPRHKVVESFDSRKIIAVPV